MQDTAWTGHQATPLIGYEICLSEYSTMDEAGEE